MNGAVHCEACGCHMRIKATNHGGGITYRIAECDCGERWELEERRARKLPSRVRAPASVYSRTQPSTDVESRPPPPTAANPCGTPRGVGGVLPSGSDPGPESGPISTPPDQTRARSNTPAIDYPKDFVILWEQTGKRGGKFPALKAWMKVGRPTWPAVQETWRAYLLSERPIAGFVQDLSTWLNARGHQQEWPPAAPRATPINGHSGVKPWVQAERDEEARKRAERNADIRARREVQAEIDAAIAAGGVK